MTTRPAPIADPAHVWLTGDGRAVAAWLNDGRLSPLLVIGGHRRLRGPFTAAGALMRAIVPDIRRRDPDLIRRYDIEILTAAPDLSGEVENSRTTLTSEAEARTRTGVGGASR